VGFVLVLTAIYLKLTGRSYLKGLYLPAIFFNSGNLGLSLSLFAFGAEGLSVAIILHTAMVVLVYSLGVFILAKEKDFWSFLKLPHLYVCSLALLFNVCHWPIPLFISRAVDLLGQPTIPLMLFLLGFQLSQSPLNKHLNIVIPIVILRIFGGLAAALLFISLLHLQGITAAVIILVATLPSAIVTEVLNRKYGENPELCASAIAVSTIVGLISIPVILFVSMKYFILP
jgi:hypothetical protein